MKPTRNWFQYSLRMLLVLVTFAALSCSWLALRIERGREEHAAAKAVLELQGDVQYDYIFDDSGREIPDAKPPSPEWVRRILGFDPFSNVAEIRVGHDAQLAQLKHFARLRTLVIYCDSEVTSTGLAFLRDAPQLRELSFGREKQLGDACLANIRCLTRLEHLDLEHLNITDAALAHLQGLANLKKLALGGKVTTEGLRRLQQALPNCRIHWVPPTQYERQSPAAPDQLR